MNKLNKSNVTFVIDNFNQCKSWTNEHGDFHRLNGPALIKPDGSEYWLKNGLPHRDNGPAIIRSNGSKNII